MRALILVVLAFVALCSGLNEYSDYDASNSPSVLKFLEEPLGEEERIIGGEEAENGKRPWMAWIKALDKDGITKKRCGGTILSPTMILTAAQCLWVERPSAGPVTVEVIVGDVDYTSGSAITIKAKEWLIHPDFSWNILNNDIALINLTTPIQFNEYAFNISFPSENQIKNMDKWIGRPLTAQGWGTYGGDSDPNCPQAGITGKARKKRAGFDVVHMVAMNVTVCRKKLREVYYDLPKMALCLETNKGQFGVCGSDRGGPVTLMLPSAPAPLIAGIISHSERCPSKYPNTFTFIGPYLEWIAKNGGPPVQK